MALLARIEDDAGGVRRIGFASSPVRIGRNRLNEIYLENPAVSQWHALIRFDERQGQVTLMDLGSTNGTRLNGRPLPPRFATVVTQQDQVNVGPVRLNVFIAAIPPELLETGQPSSFDTRELGGKATVFLDGGEDAPTQFFSPSAPGAEPGALSAQATVIMQPGMQLDMPGAPRPAPGPRPEDLQAVQSAVARTRPAYDDYRQAWREVHRQLQGRLKEAPPHLRQQIAYTLKNELPQIAKEPDFHDLVQEFNLGPGLDTDVDTTDWLHRLKYGAKSQVPKERLNPRLAMERVGALLETFAESFISLRRGYEQFGEDMALRVVHEQTPLTAARDHQGVLQVLLNWNADGSRSVEELKRAFADLAMHQVALLHGTVEGVRHLLHDIDPESLETGKSTALAQANLSGATGPLFKNRRLWKIYMKVHKVLVEEDRFSREVFGRPFARAYFDMTGGRLQDQEAPPSPQAPQATYTR